MNIILRDILLLVGCAKYTIREQSYLISLYTKFDDINTFVGSFDNFEEGLLVVIQHNKKFQK